MSAEVVRLRADTPTLAVPTQLLNDGTNTHYWHPSSLIGSDDAMVFVSLCGWPIEGDPVGEGHPPTCDECRYVLNYAIEHVQHSSANKRLNRLFAMGHMAALTITDPSTGLEAS